MPVPHQVGHGGERERLESGVPAEGEGLVRRLGEQREFLKAFDEVGVQEEPNFVGDMFHERPIRVLSGQFCPEPCTPTGLIRRLLDGKQVVEDQIPNQVPWASGAEKVAEFKRDQRIEEEIIPPTRTATHGSIFSGSQDSNTAAST